MELDERLAEIAEVLVELKEQKVEIEKEQNALRTDLFDLIDEYYNERPHLRAVRTIDVPQSFFETTGLTKQKFLETRFPGWELTHEEEGDPHIFILEKLPRFLPYVVEAPGIKVSKVVSEYTPEVDWVTLQKEDEELARRIGQPVVTWEVNDKAIEDLAAHDPEKFATLQRHLKSREPSLKILPTRVKE